MSDRKVRNNFTHYHREGGGGESLLWELSVGAVQVADKPKPGVGAFDLKLDSSHRVWWSANLPSLKSRPPPVDSQ